MEITYKKILTETGIFYTSLQDIIESIQSNQSIKEKIRQLRSTDIKKEQDELKGKLPIFYPNIWLSDAIPLRNNKQAKSTGLVQFDIDKIKIEKSKELKSRLITDCEYLAYAFISPREGLKFAINTDFVLADIDTISKKFQEAYKIAKEYVEQFLDDGVETDDSMKTINQGCLVSWDEEVFFNESPKVFPVVAQAEAIWQAKEEERIKRNAVRVQYENENIDSDDVMAALGHIDASGGYDYRMGINMALMKMLGADNAIAVLSGFWIHDNPKKIMTDLRNQAKTHSTYPYDRGHFFRTAIDAGYKTTHPGRNKRAEAVKSTGQPIRATFERNEVSAKEGAELLKEIVSRFFETKQDTAILAEAGLGKSSDVLSFISEKVDGILKGGVQIRVAYFVQEHKLGAELIGKFLTTPEKKGLTKYSAVKAFQRVRGSFYRPIMGFSKTCEILRIENRSDEEREIYSYQEKVCKECDFYSDNDCVFQNQFRNTFPGIRFYAHQHLFSPASLDFGWKPDYIIIDEDIVSNMLDVRKVKDSVLVDEILAEYCDKSDSEIEDVLAEYVSDIETEMKKTRYKIRKGLTENEGKGVCDTRKITSIKQYLDDLMLLYHISKREGLAQTGVWVRSNKEKCWLEIGDKKKIHDKWEGIPMLYMDASGEKIVISGVLERDFEFHKICVRNQDNVEILQVANNSFSKNWLKEHREDVVEVAQMIDDDTTSFISYRDVKSSDTDSGDKPSDDGDTDIFIRQLGAEVKTLYFGGLRGKDIFKDCEQLVVIGRQMIPSPALAAKAQIIFDSNKELSEERIFTPKIVKMKNGKYVGYTTQSYANPEMEVVSRHLDKAETYQAIHRSRNIHGNQKKRIILMTNDVLDVTVSKFIRFEDLLVSDARKKLIWLVKEMKVLPLNKNARIAELTELTGQQVKNMKNKHKNGWLKDNPYFRTETLNVKMKGKNKSVDCLVWWKIELEDAEQIAASG